MWWSESNRRRVSCTARRRQAVGLRLGAVALALGAAGSAALAEDSATEALKALGGKCAIRQQAALADAYASGFLSLTRSQMVGFAHNWKLYLAQQLRNEEAFKPGLRWFDGLVVQHFERPKALGALFGIESKKVWLLLEDGRDGNLTSFPTTEQELRVAITLLDQFVCTSNAREMEHRKYAESGKLAPTWAVARSEQADGFTDPTVRYDNLIASYQQINAAGTLALVNFKAEAPVEYDLALRSRALFAAAVKEEASVTAAAAEAATPAASTPTLQELAGVGDSPLIGRVARVKAQELLWVSEALSDTSYLATTPAKTKVGFEAKLHLLDVADKAATQAVQPSSKEVLVRAIEAQRQLNPKLTTTAPE